MLQIRACLPVLIENSLRVSADDLLSCWKRGRHECAAGSCSSSPSPARQSWARPKASPILPRTMEIQYRPAGRSSNQVNQMQRVEIRRYTCQIGLARIQIWLEGSAFLLVAWARASRQDQSASLQAAATAKSPPDTRPLRACDHDIGALWLETCSTKIQRLQQIQRALVISLLSYRQHLPAPIFISLLPL